MKNTAFLFFLALFLNETALISQLPVQLIRGQVIDRDSRQPLPGATVRILELLPQIGAATDADGFFELQNVPVGRHRIEVSFIGYESILTDNLLVNAAKQVNLAIELTESASKNTNPEVVISARKQGNAPLNELAVVSTRSFSVDETQRYAASANDPGRMAQGFPGVQPSRDSRSDIIVRGNSAVGLAWRLEGVDIPNPNHFARIGTSGGGITVFSTSLLGQSDFSTGAFPAEYGNATAGIFDIHFRKGNAERREFTFKAGLLGLDFSTEGPFKKGSRASYLVNYRYSTLGILNKMGIHLVGPRTDNTFQDVSLNLYFPSKNNRHQLNFWAIGGGSNEFYKTAELADWKRFDDWHQYDFQTKMGAIGLSHTMLLGDDAYVKTSWALMGQQIDFQDDTLDAQLRAGKYNDENYLDRRLTLATVYSKKFSPKISLKTGWQASRISFDLNRWGLETGGPRYDINSDFLENEAHFLLEPWVNLRIRPTEKLTLNLGVHATIFTINSESKSLEPRVGLAFQVADNQRVSVGYGLHSRALPLGTYAQQFLVTEDGVHFFESPENADLPLMKAHHFVVGYDLNLGGGFKIHPEIYWQKLFDVPVSSTPGDPWSMLNTISDFPNRRLVSEGTGQNFGLDLSIEKAFERSLFLLFSTSIFKSEYTDFDKKTHPTAFDSGLSASMMGGKEWAFGKNSVFQTGWKIVFNGGQRLTPLLPGAPVSRYSKQPPLDPARPFSEKVSPYFRPDLRLAWRKNGAKTAWQLGLDIQNVISRRNIDAISRTFDPDLNAFVFRKQSGLTPILSFQIDF